MSAPKSPVEVAADILASEEFQASLGAYDDDASYLIDRLSNAGYALVRSDAYKAIQSIAERYNAGWEPSDDLTEWRLDWCIVLGDGTEGDHRTDTDPMTAEESAWFRAQVSEVGS